MGLRTLCNPLEFVGHFSSMMGLLEIPKKPKPFDRYLSDNELSSVQMPDTP